MSPARRYALALPLLLAWTHSAHAQCQLGPVTATGAQGDEQLGWAVSLDAGHALVGAPFASGQHASTGAAYVFHVDSGQALLELFASDGLSAEGFGWSVALDGARALVGAPYDDPNGPGNSGSAYLFDATTGVELFKLSPPIGSAGAFGMGVALQDDLAVVGAPYFGEGAGAAHVFDATTGQHALELTTADRASGDYFGHPVAIEGDRILVGATGDDDVGTNAGAVYVFDLAGQELFKLTASDGWPWAGFGAGLAFHGDRAVIGATGHHPQSPRPGAAYVFDLGTGLELFQLQASDAVDSDSFGASVAVHGTLAVVGAGGNDEPLVDVGAAYLFDVSTGQQLARFGPAGGGEERDLFGNAVGLSAAHLVVGAPGDDDAGDDAGAAHLYTLASALGARYCGPANLNSTGSSAFLTGSGCADVASNVFWLSARQLPPDVVGYAIASETQAFVPFVGGSQGNLCLGGNVARFRQQVGNSGPTGEIVVLVDLGHVPTNPPQPVLPGQTWSFQCWYRDTNPLPTSNLTDGLAITFE